MVFQYSIQFMVNVSGWMTGVGFMAGILTGFISSCMRKIPWEKNEQTVVQMEVKGIFILILCIFLAVFRSTIIISVAHLPEIASHTFAVMLGSYFPDKKCCNIKLRLIIFLSFIYKFPKSYTQ